MADGSYDSKYTKIDSEGKISCSNIVITGDSSEFKIVRNTKENVFSDGNLLDVRYSTTMSLDKIEISRDVITREDYSTSITIKPDGIYAMGTIQVLDVTAQAMPVIRNVGDVVTSENISLRNLSFSLSELQTNVTTYYQPFGSSGASLKSGQNLNEFYSGVILGAGMGNAPNDGWWLVVSGGTGGTVTQRAYSLWNGLCYWRYCAAGNWSGWNSTINGTDISVSGSITSGQITCTNLASNSAESTTSKPNVFAYNAGRLIRSTNTSSRRFKDDIKPLENDDLNPDKLYDIGIYQFKYRQDYLSNRKDTRYRKDLIGFIAEEIFEKYPIAADYEIDKDGKVVVNAWNEQYLIPAMLKLIQDQHMQLINQEMKIKILEDKVMFM